MKFTGHERDLASLAGAGDDLDYMHARHCSPFTGRFLSVDRAGGYLKATQSWNRYAYSRGNPMKYVDSSGLDIVVAPALRDAVRFAYANSPSFRAIYDKVNGNHRMLAFLNGARDGFGGSLAAASTRWRIPSEMKTIIDDQNRKTYSGVTDSEVKLKGNLARIGGSAGHELQHVLELSLFGDIRNAPSARPTAGYSAGDKNAPVETEPAKELGDQISEELSGGGSRQLTDQEESNVFGPTTEWNSLDDSQRTSCLSDLACLTQTTYERFHGPGTP
jgi:RHS repeat-associated protein